MTNSIETFTHTFALPPCPDHLGSRHHTQGRSRWYEHHTQQLHRRLSKLPLPIYRSIECVGCYTSVHSARSRQQCSVTSSYTVHTYTLFVHVYVWCVARSRSHSRRAIIDEAGGGSYPIRVHVLAGAHHFVAVQHMWIGREG